MSLLQSGTILRAPRDLSTFSGADLRRLVDEAVQRNDLAEAALGVADMLRRSPHDAALCAFAGLIAQRRDRLAEALDLYRRAEALDPRSPDVLAGFAWTLVRLRRWDDAIAYGLRCRAVAPNHAFAANTLGIAYCERERYDEAIPLFEHAMRQDPALGIAEWNLAITRLRLGDFERGWQGFEARRRTTTWRPRPFVGPELASLADARGRRVLCYAEQGLGDTIQFARYATLLAGHAAEVILEVQAPLVGLLRHLPRVRILADGSPPPPYDAHIPLMSLPRLFETRVDTVPWPGPTVTVPDDIARSWAARLGDGGFRVGLVWSGNPGFDANDLRSFPLAAVRPLARTAGIRLIALQKGPAAAQVSDLPPDMRIETLGVDATLSDTAAVMQHCHLVISCCTGPAHLAGALGRPTWIALHRPGDWRWLRDRTDTPWYPTARLFRQPRAGDWASVFEAMAAALPTLMRPPSH